MKNLTSLALDNNDLTGEIPRELGSLTNLEYLTLNNNDLTGEIPRELGSLNLEYLSAQRDGMVLPIETGPGRWARILGWRKTR